MFDYQAPEQHLKDKVILVTGAGEGIGKAAALNFARQGASVILLGRNAKKLEAVYDQIEAEGLPSPVECSLNLENATINDYSDLSAQINEEFGRLDGLLLNAGQLGKLTSLENYDHETWQRVMNVNLNSQFLLTQAMLPLLNSAESASIVFTSSGVGRKGRAHWGAYAVSKFATEGMMQVLADELDGVSEVRANCINPGATATTMRSNAYPAEDPSTLATPEEIMPLYLYLLGDDSKAVNGQSLDAQ